MLLGRTVSRVKYCSGSGTYRRRNDHLPRQGGHEWGGSGDGARSGQLRSTGGGNVRTAGCLLAVRRQERENKGTGDLRFGDRREEGKSGNRHKDVCRWGVEAEGPVWLSTENSHFGFWLKFNTLFISKQLRKTCLSFPPHLPLVLSGGPSEQNWSCNLIWCASLQKAESLNFFKANPKILLS